MSEVVQWLFVLFAPFVAGWCVLQGRGVGGALALLTGALAFAAYTVAGCALLFLDLSGREIVATWLVGLVGIGLMRRHVVGLVGLVARATGTTAPPRVGQDIRKIPLETLIQGFAYPREEKGAETQ